jgi:hypothetical protein
MLSMLTPRTASIVTVGLPVGLSILKVPPSDRPMEVSFASERPRVGTNRGRLPRRAATLDRAHHTPPWAAPTIFLLTFAMGSSLSAAWLVA